MEAAAAEESVTRVVVTSSTCTLIPRRSEEQHVYSEVDWVGIDSIEDGRMKGYIKSKILAEKAAWDFYNKKKKSTSRCFELSTVLPSFSCGPILSSSSGPSMAMLLDLLNPSLSNEKIDDFVVPMCDVRDVALAHLRAAQLDEAAGRRFMIISRTRLCSLYEVAQMLNELGYKTNEVVRSSVNQDARLDNSNMRNVLKIEPTDLRKSIADAAESLIAHGLVKRS